MFELHTGGEVELLNLILEKRDLNQTTTLLRLQAPEIAAKALPGQFVIVRTGEMGEFESLSAAPSNVSSTRPSNREKMPIHASFLANAALLRRKGVGGVREFSAPLRALILYLQGAQGAPTA